MSYCAEHNGKIQNKGASIMNLPRYGTIGSWDFHNQDYFNLHVWSMLHLQFIKLHQQWTILDVKVYRPC
jgi:hypothetical protein